MFEKVASIVGIVGSPRVKGNTEYLVTEALKIAQDDGVKTELVRLAEREIRPCDGCLVCRTTGECRIKDDFKEIYEKMVSADGIILASPVYFSSATPEIKALIDRAGYYAHALELQGKGRVFENKVGGAIVVGRRGGHNFTLAQLLFFFLNRGMIIPGSTYWNIAIGKEKGDVSQDKEGIETIRNFSKKMVWLIKKIKE